MLHLTFKEEGTLGLELVESNTGWPVLKTKASGQAKQHNLVKKDVLVSINKVDIYPNQFVLVLKSLRSCGRPVTLTFIRCATAVQRMTYLGENVENVGAFGLPPQLPRPSPRGESGERVGDAPPPPPNKPTKPSSISSPSKNTDTPGPPPNKPRTTNVAAAAAAAAYNTIGDAPIVPRRTRPSARRDAANKPSFSVPSRNTAVSKHREEPQFRVPARQRGGASSNGGSNSSGGSSNGDTSSVAGNSGFKIPPRRGGSTEQKDNTTLFQVPPRRRGKQRVKVQTIAVKDTSITGGAASMYASVTGVEVASTFVVPSRKIPGRSGGGGASVTAAVEPSKPTKSGFYGMATSPHEDVSGGVTKMNPKTPHRPRKQGVVIIAGGSKTLGRHGSDLFKQSMQGTLRPSMNRVSIIQPYQQQPNSVPDPQPQNAVGSVASALGGLMADLDQAVRTVSHIAPQRRYTITRRPGDSGKLVERDAEGNEALAVDDYLSARTLTGINAEELTSWEREARGLAPVDNFQRSNDCSSGSIGGRSSSSISTKTRIRDPYEITGEAPPLKLTKSMIFGKKSRLVGGNAGGLLDGGSITTSSDVGTIERRDTGVRLEVSGSDRAHAHARGGASSSLTVQALYPIEAENSDELTCKKDDFIYDVTVKDEDWYFGYLKGKRKCFPKNYVKAVQTSIRKTKYAFAAEHSDEISFPKNVTVEGVEKKDDEWSWLTYNGRRGVAPTSYLASADTSSSDPLGASNGYIPSSTYVPGSLTSDAYIPGQFSSSTSAAVPIQYSSTFSSSPPALPGLALDPLARARQLLGKTF